VRWSEVKCARSAHGRREKKRGGKGEGYNVWDGVECARSAHGMRKGKGEGYRVGVGLRERERMRGMKGEME
jgi:hypothetical protein